MSNVIKLNEYKFAKEYMAARKCCVGSELDEGNFNVISQAEQKAIRNSMVAGYMKMWTTYHEQNNAK